MYNNFFGFRQTPFSVTPDPEFFYTNPLYQESLDALRYGIESRKGLIVVTGEAGTGKTTLLRRLMDSLPPTIHSVFILHSYLNFSELLELVCRDLGLQVQGKGMLAMVDELSAYLNAEFKKGNVVALLIDEAHKLSDASLEGLRFLSNLHTDKVKLLQIILMGPPELDTRLDDPALRDLKQRVSICCRLAPLGGKEVGAYIDFRLQSAGYEGKGLFPRDAVDRVALYSRGSPRLINIICDNALLIAYRNSERPITAKIIERVARDLRLGEPTRTQANLAGATASETKEKEKVSRAAENHAAVDKGWESGSEALLTTIERLSFRRPHRGPSGVWLGLLVAVVLLAGAGVLFYSQQTRAYLGDLRTDFQSMIARRSQGTVQKTGPAGDPAESPSPRSEALSMKNRNREVSPTADTDAIDETRPAQTGEPEGSESSAAQVNDLARRSAETPGAGKVPTNGASIASSIDHESRRRRLQLEIYKAIRNRAIAGVQVFVTGGTVYLDGRVATEAQKLAAEKAAHSVSGVEYVRNRIVVNSLVAR